MPIKTLLNYINTYNIHYNIIHSKVNNFKALKYALKMSIPCKY